MDNGKSDHEQDVEHSEVINYCWVIDELAEVHDHDEDVDRHVLVKSCHIVCMATFKRLYPLDEDQQKF